jgi:dipeptidyl aminopeptidase/acylaminoacyl peptidase
MGQPFHLGPWVGRTILWPAVESAFLYARWRYGLNMEKVSPEDAVAASKVPVLLIHGESDTNIPLRHSLRIVERRKDVVLWKIPNTGHSNAIDTAPEELQTRLISWFEQHGNSQLH